MLPTIVFLLALALSVSVLYEFITKLVMSIANKTNKTINPIYAIFACLLWSWLFWLLN